MDARSEPRGRLLVVGKVTHTRRWAGWALVAAAAALVGIALFRHLSYPLLWADEAETALFAERVLEHGYPKVHGPRNVVY